MARRDLLLPPAYLALRVLTSGWAPIAGALALDPLPVFLALRMRDRTDADPRALLFLPGLILGDLLMGMGTWTIVVRCVLLATFCLFPEEGEFHRRCWVWTVAYAMGTAIVVDLQGWLPLGFVTLMGIVQGVLWWGLLSPRTGGGPLHSYWALLFPPLALLALHLLLPTPAVWPFPSATTHSSPWVRGFAILIFLEPFVWRLVLFFQGHHDEDPTPDAGHHQHLWSGS